MSRGSGGSAVSVSYDYDHNGLRTRKQVTENGVTTSTEYRLHGKRVTHLTQKAAGDGAAEELHFYYDAEGRPEMVDWNGAVYTYLHNVQGDVTGIVDNTGSIVVEYKYDAWGYPIGTSGTLTTTLGRLNPFRYRGYVYDEETGLYYATSRYYNPEIGRFISPDDINVLDSVGENVLQYNLYAYCLNDPVDLMDESGYWPSWATKIAIGVGAVLIGAAVVAATAATGGAAAAFVGAAVAGAKAAVISGAIGAGVGAGTSAISHRVLSGSWDGVGEVAMDGAIDGFANGFMNGGIMAGGAQVISGGFKLAANAGVPTGRNGGISIGDKVRVLSPNHPKAYEAGGTLLKMGSKYRNIRFDVGSKSVFHMNIQLAKKVNYHFPLGIIGAGLWGGII